jgi:DNA-binding Xre family transcriptional regulator
MDMSKKELMSSTGISKSTIDKMGRGEQVSMDIIERLCNHFSCNIEDVICFIPNKENNQ